MARMRVLLVLVLALTAGGVLAFATYNYVQKPARTVTIPTRAGRRGRTDLDVGAELKAEDIRIIDWPANAVPRTPSRSQGSHRPRVDLPVIQNEPIPAEQAGVEGAGAGLPPAIPPGLRAVSVRVNEVIGVAGYVLPGTRVDVVVDGQPDPVRAPT